MDIKSSEFWLRSILTDINLPQNQEKPVDFITWFAEHYVLPVIFEHTLTESVETILISIGDVKQTFQRTKKSLLFSIHVSEWGKV